MGQVLSINANFGDVYSMITNDIIIIIIIIPVVVVAAVVVVEH